MKESVRDIDGELVPQIMDFKRTMKILATPDDLR